MFVAVDNEPLTSDLLRQLSAGAVKLLLAVRAEPGESQARYITILGFCERSVRNFGRELLDFGLVQRTVVPGAGRRTYQAPRTRHQSKYQADSRSLVTGEAPVVNAIPMVNSQTDTDLWLTGLNEAQQVGYGLLRGQGVEPNVAHDLVQKCDQALISAAITYSQNRRPNSPAAYLVWCLKNAALWYQLPATPVDVTEVSNDPTVAPIQTSLFAAAAVGSAESGSSTASAGLTAVNLTVVTNTEHGLLDTQIAIQPETFDTLLLAYAVEAATGSDVRLNDDARQMVEQLQQAGYTAEDVAVFADEVFPQCDWRGQKGEQPTLVLLRDGIAAVRHQLNQARTKPEGLLHRVQAIRRYTRREGEGVSLMTLGELWSSEVRGALVAEARVAEYCPGCDLPWAMCRCEERQPTPDCRDVTARWWQVMIGHMKVGLARTTFETYVAPLRLIGFEPDVVGDRFVAECLNDGHRDWLSMNLLPQMVEVLTRLHYHSANTVEGVRVQVHIALVSPPA